MDRKKLWRRYQQYLCSCPSLGLTVDVSRVPFTPAFLKKMDGAMARAYDAMAGLEAGEVANPDEGRMVGHYWLRSPRLAPTDKIAKDIRKAIKDIKRFAADVHDGKHAPAKGKKFTDVLQVGIGGSALGPQLVADCLGTAKDKMNVHFMDNTDPDGIARTLNTLGTRLKSTLVLVVSKSGGTPETRNGMLETQAAFENRGLDFAKQAVAVTGDGSKLDKVAKKEKWLARFPMWDWVGGRYSLWSAIGLPIMLALGNDAFRELSQGAKAMDQHFASAPLAKNMPALLGLLSVWYINFYHTRTHAILPYDHHLRLFPSYLQQLEMESNGKSVQRNGEPVTRHTSAVIWGEAGTNGQHSFHQLLHQGTQIIPADFILPLSSHHPRGEHHRHLVANALSQSQALMEGKHLQQAIEELQQQGMSEAAIEELAPHKVIAGNKPSNLIMMDKLTPRHLGALIALYEHRTFVQSVIWNINPFDQWGVELGKQLSGPIYQSLSGQDTISNPSTAAAIERFRRLNPKAR